jgi:hypothetical protein
MAMAYLIEYLTEIQRLISKGCPLLAVIKAIACIKIDKQPWLVVNL